MDEEETEEDDSEFGKGLTYCIGLFLAHEAMHRAGLKLKDGWDANLWFNGASDHLYELQIPESYPDELKGRLLSFKERVLDHGHGSGLMERNVTPKDIAWALEEAKALLREIDGISGVDTMKGSGE